MRVLGFLPLIVGCGQMAIDGRVVDVAGEPLPGAVVTAKGSRCQTTTDAQGDFKLPCDLGTYDIYIGAAGYISEEVKGLDATERKRYDLGKRVLIRMPEVEGLLRFTDTAYLPMERAWLDRRSGGLGRDAYRHYCLPEGVEQPRTTLSPGVHAFFDNKTQGAWRVFRLDAEGCAYRMSPKSDTQWGVDFSDIVEFESRVVERDRSVVLIDLQPGLYFVADWEAGFFVKGRTPDGEDEGYLGSLLEVGGR